MTATGGYMGKSYDINLSTQEVKDLPISQEDWALYLGGKGIGARLLYDYTRPGLDSYDEGMPIIFSTGPLSGTSAPQSNRFVVTTKSPLTTAITGSACGGSFATKLKKAGVDVVMVRGKAEKPVYIEITEAGAKIKDATALWGKGASETQEQLPKGFGKAVIGPAGENLVRYACVVSDERVAGRTGCGAVMGAKKLKAVIANGKKPVEIMSAVTYKKYLKHITKFLRSHPITGGILPALGTAHLVGNTAGRNILPTLNFQRGQDWRAVEISGEAMARHYLKKKVGCLSCPVNCGRGIELGERLTKGPEYETVAMLGSNLGNYSLPNIFEWNYLCDDLGMDTISTASSIAFATELTQRGMLESNLTFDSHEHLSSLIQDIAHRRGLGDDLAEGVKRMSEKYGGREFAIHAKGLELPAYDPRGCVGQGLEYATTNRGGCHTQGATMFLEATGPLSIDPLSIKSKPELVILQQNLMAAISSSVFCIFTTYALIPKLVFKLNPQGWLYRAITKIALHSGWLLRLVLKLRSPFRLLWFEKFLSYVMGKRITLGRFSEIGERVFNLERVYNLREGFTKKDDTLPERLLNESTFAEREKGVPLDAMLPKYYKIRGWDADGVPKPSTLRRLRIRA